MPGPALRLAQAALDVLECGEAPGQGQMLTSVDGSRCRTRPALCQSVFFGQGRALLSSSACKHMSGLQRCTKPPCSYAKQLSALKAEGARFHHPQAHQSGESLRCASGMPPAYGLPLMTSACVLPLSPSTNPQMRSYDQGRLKYARASPGL